MATINKQMKTFNVPAGNDTTRYEIVDENCRKAVAKDWATNSTSAYSIGEYVMKDGKVYRFTSAHSANTAWDASQVAETNLGNEIYDTNNNVVAVQSNQPSSTYNKLWIKDQAEAEYTVPTYAEFEDVKSAFNYEIDYIHSGNYESTDFIQGARAGTIPQTVIANANRITTEKIFHLFTGDTITVSNIKTGNKVVIGCTNGFDSGWKTADYTYTAPVELYAIVNEATQSGTSAIVPSDSTTKITVTDESSRIDKSVDAVDSIATNLSPLEVIPYNREAIAGKPNSLCLGIKFHDNMLELNGDTSVLQTSKRVYAKLNGNVVTTIEPDVVDTLTDQMIQTISGHIYNANLRLVSGNINDDNMDTSVTSYPVSLVFYKSGTHSTVGNIKNDPLPGYKFSRYWESDGSAINVFLFVPKGVVFTDAKFEFYFCDVDAVIAHRSNTESVPVVEYETGTITDGKPNQNTSGRVRTTNYVSVGKGSSVYAPGKQISVVYYDSKLKWVNSTEWTADRIDIDKDSFIRVVAQSSSTTDLNNATRIDYCVPSNKEYMDVLIDSMSFMEQESNKTGNVLNGVKFESGYLSAQGVNTDNVRIRRTRGYIGIDPGTLVVDYTMYETTPRGRIAFYNSQKEFV